MVVIHDVCGQLPARIRASWPCPVPTSPPVDIVDAVFSETEVVFRETDLLLDPHVPSTQGKMAETPSVTVNGEVDKTGWSLVDIHAPSAGIGAFMLFVGLMTLGFICICAGIVWYSQVPLYNIWGFCTF